MENYSGRHIQSDIQFYQPPEAFSGEQTATSDIWSLGITLIELAEGKNPFSGCSERQMMTKLLDEASPSLSSSEWSAEFVDFVSKCLVKDVKERWNVDQLMDVSVCLKSDE